MNNESSSDPNPIGPVRVKRHKVDWEASDLDLAEITGQRAATLAPRIATGCWFLNARYTVFSTAPTAEFFRTVLNLRSTWLRTCRQSLSNHGQRSEVRKAERQGRLAALLETDQEGNGDSPASTLPVSVPWTELSDSQRREVIQSGHLAKNLSFSGVLFIDNELIPPRTWQQMADDILRPSKLR